MGARAFSGPCSYATGPGVTSWAEDLEEQRSRLEEPHTPFRDEDEWDLAKWLVHRTNQTGIEEFLKLKMVRVLQNVGP